MAKKPPIKKSSKLKSKKPSKSIDQIIDDERTADDAAESIWASTHEAHTDEVKPTWFSTVFDRSCLLTNCGTHRCFVWGVIALIAISVIVILAAIWG